MRSKLEDASGGDLSRVRIHTGPESARAAEAISAHAYADGADIHFAAGRYAPETPEGRRLIAHEVAHAVQAGSRQPDLRRISRPGDRAELAADRFAHDFASGRPTAQPAASLRASAPGSPVAVMRYLSPHHRQVLIGFGVNPEALSEESHPAITRALEVLLAIESSGPNLPTSVGPYAVTQEVETNGDVETQRIRIEASDLVAELRLTQRGDVITRDFQIQLASGQFVRLTRETPARRIVDEFTMDAPPIPARRPRPRTAEPAPRRERARAPRQARSARDRRPPEVDPRAQYVLDMITRIEQTVRGLVEDVDQEGLIPTLRRTFDEEWPVGGGARLDTGVGATFAIPVYAGGQSELVVDRVSEDVVEITRITTLELAADTGVGVGASLNLFDTVGIQARAEARATGGHRAVVHERFAFPIGTDEEFVAFLAVLGGTTSHTMAMAIAASSPEAAAIDPEQYLTERTIRYGLFGDAEAEAGAGFTAGRRRPTRHRGGEVIRDEHDRPIVEEQPARTTRRWGNTELPMRNEVRDGDLQGNTAPMYLALLRGVSAQLHVGLEGSAEVSFEPEHHSARRRRQQPGESLPPPEWVDVSFTLQGTAAVDFGLSIASLVELPWSFLATNPGLGLRVTVRVHDPDGARRLDDPRYQLVVTSGNVDAPTGAASETVTSLDTSARTAFGLLQSVSHRQRWTLAVPRIDALVPFVRRRLDSSLRADGMPNLARGARMSSLFAGAELHVDCQLDFDPERVIAVIMGWGEDVFEEMRQQGIEPTRARVVLDVLTWLETGRAPAYIARTDELLDALLEVIRLRRLRIVADVSVRGDTDLRAAFGAKLRLRGHGEGALRFTLDLMNGEDALTAAEALPLVRELMTTAERDVSDLLRQLPDR